MNSPFSSSSRGSNVTRYEFRGASIDAPRDWVEESVLSIAAPGPRPQPTVTLVRSTVPEDTTIELFAGQRIAELSRIVAGLQVEESREIVFGGQRGMSLRFFWEELPGRVIQRLVFGRFDDAMYVLAMNCFADQVEKIQPTFESIATSFRAPVSR